MEDEKKEKFAARRNRLRELFKDKGIDALLVSNPVNRYYLSGFELHDPQPDESSGYIIVTQSGDDWLATDSRYTIAAEKIWDKNHILIYSSKTNNLQKLLTQCGSIIGVESKLISLDLFHQLQEKKNFSFVPRLVPADGMIESLRLIKDADEISALKASFALNHKLFLWIEENITEKCKCTEKELSWEIERFFRENGAQELAFSSIVARAENAAMPHAVPTDVIIGNNVPLLVDAGCRICDYCSDQTRTWWIGQESTKEFSKTLKLVKEAQKVAIDCIKPGVPCKNIYEAAYKVFQKAGVEKAFTHGLGHGVGLQVHESPSLSTKSEEILQAGMTVTVEPGLYYPDWGGIRWEYTILVEKDGAVLL